MRAAGKPASGAADWVYLAPQLGRKLTAGTSILAFSAFSTSLFSIFPRHEMAAMNAPEGDVKFVPKQALAPSPQLYNELVSDSMENLAKTSLTLISPVTSGATINDNGCGTGAATAAVVASLKGGSASVAVKGNDINEDALKIYRKRAEDSGWPAEGVNMDSDYLSFAAGTFDLTIGNALLFVLPNDGIDAVKEAYRTLKPGGQAIFNSWAYVPNMPPLEVAAKETRPEGSPLPRAGLEKWAKAEFLHQVLRDGGFEHHQITVHQREVYTTVAEIQRYANMLWSFIGGTTPIGWLESDERNWDRAIEVIIRELKSTDGYRQVEDGRSELKFIANIAVATK